MNGSKKAFNRRTALIIAVAAIAALCVLWFALGRDWLDSQRANDTRQKTHELFYGQSSAAPAPWFISSAKAEEPHAAGAVEADPAVDVDAPNGDFLALYAKNPDVVGWLRVGESVDEPVVKRDNAWYMNHNFFGEEDRNGTLFVNANNQLTPRDDVILIHGHNMKSGDMFGRLLSYREEAYMREHPLAYFDEAYTEGEDCFVAVAAFDASMLPDNKSYFDITQMVFDNESREGEPRQSAEYQTYLNEIQRRSYWSSPVDVTVEDELLMLVTCSYELQDGRFVLVLRRLRDNETPEGILAQIG